MTTTAATKEEAEGVARALVDGRLAACVQIVGPMESRYWWDGAVETATEWVCVAKTTADRYDEVEAAIRAVHSYDVPEILAVPVVRGSEAYVRWLGQETARR
ncbi:MAG: divalent-cation tolerance protein CutA [Actinomycetota bacterium]|nr:divalent-cation tolerance protein CutA [Actinomycetota bacterium]